MNVTHKLSMDLTLHSTPLLHMVQGERNSRWIEFSLYSNKKPWAIPKDAAALIRYKKPNLASGVYDTMADGSPAWRISGNRLCICIAPEVVSLPGSAFVTISLLLEEQTLSTFQVQLNIQSNYTGEAFLPDEPAGVTGLLPAPAEAQVGQYLVVEAVSNGGRVIRTAAADAPAPTATSQLINDSGFQTQAQVADMISDALGVIENGTY